VISRRLTSITLQGNSSILNGGAQWSDLLRFVRVGSVAVQCKPEQWKAALAIAEQELRRALKYGFTEPELEEQKKNLVSYFEQQAKAAERASRPSSPTRSPTTSPDSKCSPIPAYDLAELQRTLPLITAKTAQTALQALWKDAGPLVFISGAVTLQDPQAEILATLQASQAWR
jgi:zinc protease